MQYTVHAAKSQLSKLIDAAERGEEVIIARRDKPAVRLVPIERPTIRFGALAHLAGTEPDDWLEPMDEEELALWEGGNPP